MMATNLFTIAPRLVRDGAQTFGPWIVPAGLTGARITWDRSQFAAGISFGWTVQVSWDGGQTWTDWGGGRSDDGVGAAVPSSGTYVGLLVIEDSTTHARGYGAHAIPPGHAEVAGFPSGTPTQRRCRLQFDCSADAVLGLTVEVT